MRLFIGENEAKIRELADYLLDCSEICPRVGSVVLPFLPV